MEKERKDVVLCLLAEGVVQVRPDGGFPLSSHPANRDRTSPVYFMVSPKTAEGSGSPETTAGISPQTVKGVAAWLFQQAMVMSDVTLIKRFAGVSDEVAAYVEAMIVEEQPQLRWPLKDRQSVIHLAEKPATAQSDRRITHVDDGAFILGDAVLLVEGVMVSAHRTWAAIRALTKLGMVVTDVAVIVDRCQGGSDELQKKHVLVPKECDDLAEFSKQNIRVHALCTGLELVEFAFHQGRLTRAEYDLAKSALEHRYPDVLPDDEPKP